MSQKTIEALETLAGIADDLDAAALVQSLVERMRGGETREQIQAKLSRVLPSLTESFAEDRAKEDVWIEGLPSRDDEPTGRG